MLSVLIPARNEAYLARTIADVLENARGNVEVIAVCDGYEPDLSVIRDARLLVVHHARAEGMRQSINEAASIATGGHLMKLDAHCMMAPGFDVTLTAHLDDNWVVTPMRYGFDPVTWTRDNVGIGAHYLTYPEHSDQRKAGLHARHWKQRAEARAGVWLDDDMSFQGSCWCMSRTHWDRLGGLSVEGYGPFIQEPQEIGLKTWLGGGRVKIHRGTWYAHWRKREGQGYVLSPRQSREGLLYSTDYWMHDRWPERVHDMRWLIEQFSPVPGWPETW